jgi:hypothetical protein
MTSIVNDETSARPAFLGRSALFPELDKPSTDKKRSFSRRHEPIYKHVDKGDTITECLTGGLINI